MTDQEGNGKDVVLYAGPVTALARYGETAIVQAVARRVALFHRGKEPLLPHEALMVAQAAVYHDLDPDPAMSELQWWIDGKGDNRKLVIMRGKRGNELVANENLAAMGSYMETPRFRLVVDPTERGSLAPEARDGDLVMACSVSHYRETQDWINRRANLKDEGLKPREIDERVGAAPPSVQGIGIVTKEESEERSNPRWYHVCTNRTENKHFKNPPKRELRGFEACPDCKEESYAATKRTVKLSNVELAQKRAKRAAMDNAGWLRRPDRQLAIEGLDLSKFTVDASWVRDLGADERSTQQKQDDAAAARRSLYEGVPKRPWAADVVKDMLRQSVVRHERTGDSATEKQRGVALGVLTTAYGGGKAGNEQRHHALSYLFGVESGNDLTGPQILALLDWMKLTREGTEEDGRWVPCEYLAKELPAIYERWLAGQPGQEQMFTEGKYRVPTDKEAA